MISVYVARFHDEYIPVYGHNDVILFNNKTWAPEQIVVRRRI